MNLFPFSEYWWLYAAFTTFILALLALDLGAFNKKDQAVTFKKAAIWCAVWVTLALLFNGFLYYFTAANHGAGIASTIALEFFTGYVLEYSLSVDNIFVFVLVFSYFGIPPKYRHRVLFYGILGALVFRAIFITLGSVLMQFHWIIYIFGGFLILTGIKMFFTSHSSVDPGNNFLIRAFTRMVPVTKDFHGNKFFVKKDARLLATPLFIALLFLETTDIIFAVDSVPAIFSITNEPLIVFTSNIFAILGLRSMYFMLEGVIDKFYLLTYGLAVVLVFVGLKMVWLNPLFDGKFPITYSLAFIIGVIGTSVVLSLLIPKKADESLAGDIIEEQLKEKKSTR